VRWSWLFASVALALSLHAKELAIPPLLKEGNAALRSAEYDLAVTKYSEYIRLNPKEASGYNDRALAYKLERDYEHAISDFNESLRLHPQSHVYYNRATAFHEMDEEDKAIADYSKAIKLEPRNADFFIARGHSYFNKENDGAALGDLNAAIKLGVKDSDAYVLRGILYKVRHEYDRSLADYEKAIQLDPNNPRCYGVEAQLLSVCPVPKYRDGKRAIAYATKDCELSNWQDASAPETLAGAYAETGQFDEALKWERKATQIDPGAIDPTRFSLYEQKKPIREMNRKDQAGTDLSDIKGKVSIKLGEEFFVAFDVQADALLNPQVTKTRSEKQAGITVEFQKYKDGCLLTTKNDLPRTFHARCFARPKAYATSFETDILTFGPDNANNGT
jgi:tetratricopeptide (TPR) repeat protein